MGGKKIVEKKSTKISRKETERKRGRESEIESEKLARLIKIKVIKELLLR